MNREQARKKLVERTNMKLKALSHYNGDMNTRFGDCILLYDSTELVVYDCGHKQHAQEVENFLDANKLITKVYIVVSHNDNDHTSGVYDLIEWLYEQKRHSVSLFTHQYLKHVDTILEKIADKRMNRESLKKSLLDEFDNIATIIETAQKCEFSALEALSGTKVGNCTIAGPSIDEFTDVAAKAIDSRENDNIGEGHAEETVMNAASIQLECTLENGKSILLCGDASPTYLHNLDSYDIIQLPHHGQLADAQAIFEMLKDSYSKTYLISDNTGSGATSGGSDKLVEYMKEECYELALNTQNGVVQIENNKNTSMVNAKPKGVVLGEMDCSKQ